MKGLTRTFKCHWCWSTAESPKLREALISIDTRSCLWASPMGVTACFSIGVCVFMAVRQRWSEMQGTSGLVDKEELVGFGLSASLVALWGETKMYNQECLTKEELCSDETSCLSALCVPVDEAEFVKILEAGLNLGSMTTVVFSFFFPYLCYTLHGIRWLPQLFWRRVGFLDFFCCDIEIQCLSSVAFMLAQFKIQFKSAIVSQAVPVSPPCGCCKCVKEQNKAHLVVFVNWSIKWDCSQDWSMTSSTSNFSVLMLPLAPRLSTLRFSCYCLYFSMAMSIFILFNWCATEAKVANRCSVSFET